jgi:hypothetical protein
MYLYETLREIEIGSMKMSVEYVNTEGSLIRSSEIPVASLRYPAHFNVAREEKSTMASCGNQERS